MCGGAKGENHLALPSHFRRRRALARRHTTTGTGHGNKRISRASRTSGAVHVPRISSFPASLRSPCVFVTCCLHAGLYLSQGVFARIDSMCGRWELSGKGTGVSSRKTQSSAAHVLHSIARVPRLFLCPRFWCRRAFAQRHTTPTPSCQCGCISPASRTNRTAHTPRSSWPLVFPWTPCSFGTCRSRAGP